MFTEPGRWLTSLVLTGCAIFGSACDIGVDAEGFTTRDEKRFTVSGTPELTLATFDGAIEVRSWDRSEVQVVIERRAQSREEAETIEIKAEQSGNRISIEARRPGQEHRIGFGFHIGRSAKLIASVPRATNLLARSGDGSILAGQIEGRLELRTGDGRVTGEDLKGQLRVQTGDGNVKLSNVDGAVDLDTRDGSIGVDGRFTALRARSGDGRITVRASAGSAMSSEWDISTGDGSVEIELPNGFNAEVDAHTGDGSIDVSGLTVTATGEMRRDTVRGKIGGGGATLRVRSGDGAIRLKGGMPAEKTESPR